MQRKNRAVLRPLNPTGKSFKKTELRLVKVTHLFDMKTITVILISTALGATIGFGLSYVFLNGQILGLQQDLATLGVTIGRISDIAANMTSTIESVVDTLTTGLTAVSQYASTRVDQLQTQINALNSTLSKLNSTISGTDPRRWHDATTTTAGPGLPSDYDSQTSPFTLKSNKIQISWSMTGRSANATVTIQIHQPDGTVYLVLASSGYYNTFVNELTITEPGDYYLRIYTTNVDRYSVTIRDYY